MTKFFIVPAVDVADDVVSNGVFRDVDNNVAVGQFEGVYRFFQEVKPNDTDTFTVTDNSSPPPPDPPTPPVLSEVLLGEIENDILPVGFASLDAEDGDSVPFVIYPAGLADPDADEVIAGQLSGGGDAPYSGAHIWGTAAQVNVGNVPPDDYAHATLIVSGGQASNVVVTPFTVPADTGPTSPTGFTLTPVGASDHSPFGDPNTINLSAVAAGDWLVIGANQNGATENLIVGLTLDGFDAIELAPSSSTARKSALYAMQCPQPPLGDLTLRLMWKWRLMTMTRAWRCLLGRHRLCLAWARSMRPEATQPLQHLSTSHKETSSSVWQADIL